MVYGAIPCWVSRLRQSLQEGSKNNAEQDLTLSCWMKAECGLHISGVGVQRTHNWMCRCPLQTLATPSTLFLTCTAVIRICTSSGWCNNSHCTGRNIELGEDVAYSKPQGLPWWRSDEESSWRCRSCRRRGFNPWVRKSPWRRKWQPTPVFLPGKAYGQRSLAGYSPWAPKESDMT